MSDKAITHQAVRLRIRNWVDKMMKRSDRNTQELVKSQFNEYIEELPHEDKTIALKIWREEIDYHIQSIQILNKELTYWEANA